VDRNDVAGMDARELVATLDALGIGEGWAIGDRLRSAVWSLLPPSGPCLGDPAKQRREGFQNQIVGRIAERVFRDEHLAALEAEGFEVEDLHEEGENRDYVVHQDGLELPINVKVASTRFESAQRAVGLDPDDCIPIGAYKAIGASERVPDLLYVDMVDFSLREKVDDFMNRLEGPLGVGWHLFSWYGGKGATRAEDQYVDALFARHADSLMALAIDVERYHAISALRVLAILRVNPRRVPGLGIRWAGRGGFNAEANVHVSVGEETTPWREVASQLLEEGIQAILDTVRRKASVTVPDPQI
jgi:hypothetical protein